MKWGVAVLVLLGAFSAASCGAESEEELGGSINVFAASSLAPVIGELLETFEASIQAPTSSTISLAGSSTLREQLLAGAPGDVFISAARSHLEVVEQQRPLVDTGVVIARNRLVLAVPRENRAAVSALEDLANPDLLVGLCARAVPCGTFAYQALEELGIAPAADTEAASVTALAVKLAASELDAGVVYETNVLADQNIQGLGWRTNSTQAQPSEPPTVEYVAGVFADSGNVALAQAFQDFLVSPASQAVFARYGFE